MPSNGVEFRLELFPCKCGCIERQRAEVFVYSPNSAAYTKAIARVFYCVSCRFLTRKRIRLEAHSGIGMF